MDGEAAFGIVDETEVLAGLLDRDHIHEASWIGSIGANFAIDFDKALHNDRFGLARIEGIL